MNILIISDFILPDNYGGSGRVVDEYVNHLRLKGYNIFVLTFSKSKNLPNKEKKNGIIIYRLSKNVVSLPYSLIVYNKLIIQHKINVVILNAPFSGISSLFNLKKVNKIYVFHSPWPEEYYVNKNKKNMFYWLRLYIERIILNTCDYIVCYSQYMKNKLLLIHKLNEEKVKVIYVGVNEKKFYPQNRTEVRKKLGLPIDKFILFTARRFVPRMGLENLLFAIKEIVKEYKNILLIIAGSGPLEKRLKNIVSELKIEPWVSFVGYLNDERIVKYYQSADVFVLPTKELEGFGMVTVESLSCGTPVLGTPVGGTVEILSKLGLLFEDTTYESMAKKIKEFIKMDKEKFNSLSKICKQYVVENYSWENFVSKIEKLFKKVQ